MKITAEKCNKVYSSFAMKKMFKNFKGKVIKDNMKQFDEAKIFYFILFYVLFIF